MLRLEDIAAIVSMYYVDRLTIHQISQRTGRHHSAIKRAISSHQDSSHNASSMARNPAKCPHKLAPYREYIGKLLHDYNGIAATRIREKLAEKSVQVSIDQLRRFIRRENLRVSKTKAFIKVRTAPGEQAQIDWAHCGRIKVDGGSRPLSLFVMTLGYSRMLFARFYFDQSMASFLSAHLHAFEALGGIPETLLYDNLKSAVLSRVGGLIQFNPNLLRFASLHHFKVDACNPRSGWEKGKVERSIRYIREGFLVARKIGDIDLLNSELKEWLCKTGNKRRWPDDKQRIVADVWQEDERKTLRPVKDKQVVEIKVTSRVGKTAYVAFDSNNYSIPAKYARQEVMLWVSEEKLRVFFDNIEIALHRRSYACGKDIEDPEHIAQMLRDRRAAREQVRRRLIYQNVANAAPFFEQLRSNGVNLSTAYKKIYELASQHPLTAIDEKMAYLLKTNLVSVAGLVQLLENQPTVTPQLDLSLYPALEAQIVYRRDLAPYQKLSNLEREL